MPSATEAGSYSADVPGFAPEAIEADVERNVLTVKAQRLSGAAGEDVGMQLGERPVDLLSRQSFLDDTLDPQRIDADCKPGCRPCASRSQEGMSAGN